ncbi:polymerase 11 [Blastocystis sp. subtype 4]|uniref:polymerase 11 n=1 Tax=Blastocystis sp. subtype 4 TaxID=944170 RepID=UPI000711BE0A|nr:polymerase 11 [Blastocystis sp. subtype 4]KNB43780.1 polymerase 11 [Blastocystis sp. subtype 4]|eukprot:XP_014527223.1 polymerase 11 [Blastocystis sp. subtype 4]
MSVGELLVRFFWYYGFEFDYVHSVVTIRQRGVLDREETCCDSMWKMNMQLCIEDPFENDYDVAHVITPASSALIQETFAKSYIILMNMSKNYSELTEENILEAIFKASLYR